MNGVKQPLVGFERYVTFDWLDTTAKWVIEGKSAKEVHALIDDYLAPFIAGETSKRKTKNVLSGAWVKSNSINSLFKEQAKALYTGTTKAEAIAIHYGMYIASYPFFLSLSKILGRLFKLQDDISNKEFYRRCVEVHGERDSIKRAAARYLQSMVEWGLLDGSVKARVKPTNKIRLDNSELITWLYSSLFFSTAEDRLSLDDIVSDPAWFPFEIPHDGFQYKDSKLLEVVHQNVGSTLISLR